MIHHLTPLRWRINISRPFCGIADVAADTVHRAETYIQLSKEFIISITNQIFPMSINSEYIVIGFLSSQLRKVSALRPPRTDLAKLQSVGRWGDTSYGDVSRVFWGQARCSTHGAESLRSYDCWLLG